MSLIESPPISFIVYGRAMPQGSKTSWVPRGRDGKPIVKNGRVIVTTADANKNTKPWMASVRAAAAEVWGGRELLSDPIELSCVFYFSRRKGHFGSGRNAHNVKESAPIFYTGTPDLDKLVRAVADAMSGIIYVDDAQICRYGTVSKEWTLQQERAEISLVVLDAQQAMRERNAAQRMLIAGR